jgi:hypothetical protein
MALPATDTFTAADGTLLTTYSSNWTNVNGTFKIYSNAVTSNGSSSDNCARWNADTFNNNQYAQGTYVSEGSGHWVGVSVRCSASADSHYNYYAASDDREFVKIVAGGWTQLASAKASPAVNDVLYIEANGTTIKAKLNGVDDYSVTDESLTSGYAGICGYDQASTTKLDGWEGGDLGGGPVTTTYQTLALCGVGPVTR